MINYLSSKVVSLHKVKLAKLLWFSDNLHYKQNGVGISGLEYSALGMGFIMFYMFSGLIHPKASLNLKLWG